MSSPPAPLTGKQRSFLRALAHSLKPLVQVGHEGVTGAVISAIDSALQKHELMKLKFSDDDQPSAAEVAPEIAQRTGSSVAQVIGKTLVLYRKREKDPVIVLPATKAKPKPKK